MRKINKLLGTRYWYSVRFIYKDKYGQKIMDWTADVGLTQKKTILKAREIKKIQLPMHKIKGIPKKLLCNGNLFFEPVTYLGWFKR